MFTPEGAVVLGKLLDGFVLNLQIFVITLIGSLPLGLIIMFGSRSRLGFRVFGCKFRPIRLLSRGFVWVIRGTPLMLQLIFVFYGPGLMGLPPIKSRVTATLVTFIINYAAYFSEIFRGGIDSIPQGQYEAGQVLGMTKRQVFFKVVLLQVVKRVTPSVGNEIITLVKDTSLSRIISVTEILFVADNYTRQGLLWPLFTTAIFFLIFNGLVTLALGRIERKMDYFRA